ncbi:MAG: hypothetical protein QM752_00950 [Gammaproteobacteria bacterium]
MPRFLMTGVTGPLGSALVPQLTQAFPNFTYLALTSRYPGRIKFSAANIYPMHLDLHRDFYSSLFYSELPSLAPFDSIIHCASPYSTELLMQTSSSALRDFTQLIANEICLLRELVLNLRPGGTLIVCGSVSGMRNDSVLGKTHAQHLSEGSHIGNFKDCTIHATHKGILRDFTNCLYQSNPSHNIVHANLGPFMTSVPTEKEDEILSAAEVARQLIAVVQSPRSQTFNIDIVSPTTAKKMRSISSQSPSSVSEKKFTPHFTASFKEATPEILYKNNDPTEPINSFRKI